MFSSRTFLCQTWPYLRPVLNLPSSFGVMELFVETPTCEKRRIQVGPTEKFSSIKARLIEEIGGPPSSARSFRLTGPEVSENRTPAYHRFKNGDTLHLVSNLVQIFVNTPTGEKITLEVNVYDTIRQVKNLIEEKTEVLSCRQLLRFAGSPLENGDTVDLNDNGVDIFIKTPTGKRILLEINRNDTIESVKNQIQAKEGIPQQYQELFYGRKQLEDGNTLQEYEISSGATFYLMQLDIQISVLLMPNRERFALVVHRNDTIGDVKGKIEEKEGILRENQSLYLDFNRTSLEDDHLTVDYYNIEHGSTLTLKLNDIEINIKLPSGKCLPLNVNLYETISSVKAKIEQKTGIRPENQFFHGPSDDWAKDGDTVKSHVHLNERTPFLNMADPSISITVEMFTSRLVKRLSLKVNRNDTIAAVKRQIAQMEGAINLVNHALSLGAARLSEKSTVQSCLQQDHFTGLFELRQFDDMSIFIETLTGKRIPFTFHRNDTVQRLQEYIEDREGLPLVQQRLILNGRHLDTFRTLVSYNIQNGDTIHLFLPVYG